MLYTIFVYNVYVEVTEHDNQLDTRIKQFVDMTCYSDWVVLSLFHTNLTTVNFQNLLEDLAFQVDMEDLKKRTKTL